MGFNFYFAGALGKNFEVEFKKINAKKLYNYYDSKKAIHRWLEMGGEILIDSGAFPAYKRGVEINLDEYISFLNQLGDYKGYAIELDKIPGRPKHITTHEDILEAVEISWNNYLYMIEKCKYPEKIIPVFHRGEPIKELHKIIDYNPPSNYIAVAPMAGAPVSVKKKWLIQIFEEIKASNNPDIKIHVLGMQTIDFLNKLGCTSADSSTWTWGNKTGRIALAGDYDVFISEKQKHLMKHFDNKPKEIQDKITEIIEHYGFTIEELKTNSYKRAKLEIMYLQDRIEKLEKEEIKTAQKKLIGGKQ